MVYTSPNTSVRNAQAKLVKSNGEVYYFVKSIVSIGGESINIRRYRAIWLVSLYCEGIIPAAQESLGRHSPRWYVPSRYVSMHLKQQPYPMGAATVYSMAPCQALWSWSHHCKRYPSGNAVGAMVGHGRLYRLRLGWICDGGGGSAIYGGVSGMYLEGNIAGPSGVRGAVFCGRWRYIWRRLRQCMRATALYTAADAALYAGDGAIYSWTAGNAASYLCTNSS